MTDDQREIYTAALSSLVKQGVPREAAGARALRLATVDVVPPPHPVGVDGLVICDPLAEDKKRRLRHLSLMMCYSQDAYVTDDGGRFRGDYGQLLEAALAGLYTDGGDGRRLQMLRQITDTGYHFQTRIARAMSMLRRADLEVSGDLAQDDTFAVVWKASGFDEAARQAEEISHATGAAALKTDVTDTGITVSMIEPQNLSAWKRRESNEVGVIVHHMPRSFVVYDWRDPLFPIVSVHHGNLRRNLYGQRPVARQMGDEIRARWNGQAVLPVTIYQGAGTRKGELLPVAPVVLEATLSIVDQIRMKNWIGRVGAFPRTYVNGKVENLTAANIEPATLIGVEGATGILDKAPSTAGDMEKWAEEVERSIALYGSQFHSGVQVQRTEGSAASGYALRIRSNDRWQERHRQEGEARPLDSNVLMGVVARANAWQDAGIPEASFHLGYPVVWDLEEQKEDQERTAAAVEKNLGDVTPVDLIVKRLGGNPSDPEQRDAAMEVALRNAEEMRTMRDAGLLVSHEAAATTATDVRTPAPESAPPDALPEPDDTEPAEE